MTKRKHFNQVEGYTKLYVCMAYMENEAKADEDQRGCDGLVPQAIMTHGHYRASHNAAMY
jgi:hypothetical protein